MAQTIKLKRSAVTGQVPTVAQLELGELGINTFDGKLYYKKDDGTAVILELNGAAAGTATTISSGATAPTDPAPVDGDLWFDTANDTLMVWDGTQWTSLAGDTAQSTTTTSTTDPTTRPDGSALVSGDTYYNTENGVVYLWDGTQWVPIASDSEEGFWQSPHLGSSATVITTRPDDAPLQIGDIYFNTADSEMKVYTGIAGKEWTAIGSGGGGSITVSDTAPNGGEGDVWYDSLTDYRAYVYVGDAATGSWVDMAPGTGSQITVSDAAPAAPEIGDGWVDTGTTGTLYAWNGTAWIAVVGSLSGGSAVTISATPPASPQVGALWLDSDDDILYVYVAVVGWTPIV